MPENDQYLKFKMVVQSKNTFYELYALKSSDFRQSEAH